MLLDKIFQNPFKIYPFLRFFYNILKSFDEDCTLAITILIEIFKN